MKLIGLGIAIPALPTSDSFADTGSRLCPGQIYAGECLTSYEPNLNFRYVLLSRDRINGADEWLVAQFNMGFRSIDHFLNETEGKKPEALAMGAQIISLYPCEIIDRVSKGDLKLSGNINNA